MNQPIKTPTKAELESRVQLENEKLEKLNDVADDLEAEAQKLTVAFDADPSEELFGRKAVLSQKAKNARVAASEQQAVAQKAEGELRAYERNTIGQELSRKEETIRKKFSGAVDLIVEAIEQLDGAINELSAHHHERLAAQSQGVPLGRLSMSAIIAELSPRLASYQPSNALDQSRAYLKVEGQHTNRDAIVELHVQRAAGHLANTLY